MAMKKANSVLPTIDKDLTASVVAEPSNPHGEVLAITHKTNPKLSWHAVIICSTDYIENTLPSALKNGYNLKKGTQ